MFSVKKLSIATVGTIALGLGSIAPVNAASFYEITGLDFTPTDINNSSQVVGENYLWEDGNVTDLNTLPGANNSNLFANSINNNGAIVGGGLTVNESTTEQESIPNQAFISDGSTTSDLPRNYFCDDFACPPIVAEDINDSGTVALNYDGRVGLVLTSDGTTTEVIGTRYLWNIAINNQGQIIGSTGSYFNAVFYDENGNPVPLQTGSPNIWTNGASDIDDSGNIVGGLYFVDSGNREAALWETEITLTGVSLGTLGGDDSYALGINNSQQVVGWSTLADDSTEHAFLWEDGDLIDLNSLIDPGTGWELTSAFEINDSGDIIGIGTFNGVERGFVARAVPEPSSVLGMLGLGVFGLGGWLKRKQLSR